MGTNDISFLSFIAVFIAAATKGSHDGCGNGVKYHHQYAGTGPQVVCKGLRDSHVSQDTKYNLSTMLFWLVGPNLTVCLTALCRRPAPVYLLRLRVHMETTLEQISTILWRQAKMSRQFTIW